MSKKRAKPVGTGKPNKGKPKGFAKMKLEDPRRFAEISRKAGRASAKSPKHRSIFAENKFKARHWARDGGFARHGVVKPFIALEKMLKEKLKPKKKPPVEPFK